MLFSEEQESVYLALMLSGVWMHANQSKYFGVSQMAQKVMKVRCDRTSSSGGVKG